MLDFGHEPSGEMKLWQAKIMRQAHDAVGLLGGNVHGSARRRVQEAAAAWFRDGGPEFRATCFAAGFDPDFVRDAFMSGRINKRALQRNSASIGATIRTPRGPSKRQRIIMDLALAEIQRDPGVNTNDLSARTGVEQQALHKALAHLRRANLVEGYRPEWHSQGGTPMQWYPAGGAPDA